MSIADLLAQSRAAHLSKKRAAGTIDGAGIPSSPDYPKAEAHIAEALRLRLEAEEQDPRHESSAWAEDLAANRGVTSADLIAFYQKYPLIP